MRKFFSLVTALMLSSFATLSSVGCSARSYFDDRTPLQFEDANFILNNKLTLNPNKHVLLIGLDGIPYPNLDPEMTSASTFKANYYIQNYETMKGWTSILWGNILQKEKTIFNIIKDNSPLKTANITQWMGPHYYNGIYGSQTKNYIDYNHDFDSESDVTNYNTIEKMDNQIAKLKNSILEKTSENYNFIFTYQTYYDELKHKGKNRGYDDNDPLMLNLIKDYKDFVTSFYNTLDKNEWLIIVVTDHARNINKGNFEHPDVWPSHFSWTLVNNDLSPLLNHSFTNLYDIRTAAIKWLMQS